MTTINNDMEKITIRKATSDDINAIAEIYGKGWEVARLDTQEKNTRALKFYPKIGYRLAGIYPTRFFTLPTEIRLAMFEKRL